MLALTTSNSQTLRYLTIDKAEKYQRHTEDAQRPPGVVVRAPPHGAGAMRLGSQI